MSEDAVLLEVRDGIAHLTLNRPDAVNTFDVALGNALDAQVAAIDADPSVRAVLLTGAGARFCGGGDVKSFLAHGVQALDETLQAIIGALHRAITRLARLDAPVVGAVQGSVAGAGLGLMMSCDIVLSGASTKFVVAYTGIGVTPDGSSSWYLPRHIGTARALELTLTNRVLSADEACAWGLIARVVPDETLFDEAQQLAVQLAAGPTRAFAGARQLIRDALARPLEEHLDAEAEQMRRMSHTADALEGITAFVDKRPPTFKGE